VSSDPFPTRHPTEPRASPRYRRRFFGYAGVARRLPDIGDSALISLSLNVPDPVSSLHLCNKFTVTEIAQITLWIEAGQSGRSAVAPVADIEQRGSDRRDVSQRAMQFNIVRSALRWSII
jgi:hypothetical protein